MAEIKTTKQNEFKKVEQEKFEVSNLVVVTDSDEQFMQQIRLKIGEDEYLTHKPKQFIEKEYKMKGVNILRRETKAVPLEDIPPQVIKINKEIAKNGKAYIVTDYTLMTTYDDDGEEKQYKFLSSRAWDTLRVVDENNKEI